MDKLNKTSQKRVTHVNDFLLKTFKTSSDLNSSLKKERILPKNNYLEAGRKTLELLNSMSKTTKASVPANREKDQRELLEAEVKSLEHYKRAEPNEKIAKMIREQKDQRRERHFQLLTEYERFVEATYKGLEEQYEIIKDEVKQFYDHNDKSLRTYFKEFTPEHLLTLDKSFLDHLHSTVASNQEQRAERILNLLGRLTDVEHEREYSMAELLKGLKHSLVDNAYFLENQVDELIKEEEVKYEEVIAKQKVVNESYVDEVNATQRKTFEEFEAAAKLIEKTWRRLQHDNAIMLWREEMAKEIYTNPADRNALYEMLKAEQVDVFNKRRETLNNLSTMIAENMKKARLEKTLEAIKELNDQAQEKYDKKIEELFGQHNQLETVLKEIKEDLHVRLVDFDAALEEGLTVEDEVQQKVDEILTNNKTTLSHAIATIEEHDLKANELVTNILNFYIKLGGLRDTSEVNLKKFKFEYELDKAKLADDNDEKLDQLNEELGAKKKNIREAVHHPKLEEFLQEGFEKLDEVEAEYREFHERNLTNVSTHPSRILTFFSTLEKELSVQFDLVDESKEAEIQAKYQKEADDKVTKLLEEAEQQRLREEEELAKQAALDKNAKKPAAKAPAKKDPKKLAQEQEEARKAIRSQVEVRQVQTYTSGTGVRWLHYKTVEEFTKEFFCIKYEEGAEGKGQKNSRVPSADLKKQQEAETAAKAQELAKAQEKPPSKQAARGKQPAPNKKEEELARQQAEAEAAAALARQKEEEEKAKYFTEWRVNAPTDLHGNLLLSEHVVFSYGDICQLINGLMITLFEDLTNRQEDTLEEGEAGDKEFVENSMILLDQRLKAHYPLKGRMETEIYALRASEIVDHKKRYERHVRSQGEKLDNQTEEFNLMLEEAVESLKTYDADQKTLREALFTADSISRMDGIQNQAKDKANKFGENGAEICGTLRALAVDETARLLQGNRDFIKNLQLFSNGGFYSSEEVAWYEEMLKDVDEKIKVEAEAREKRLIEIEELLKKRKQQLITQFESEYVVALEELCAKDGTGKKYGKPKRIAQERLRTEMNKCERSQEGINKLLTSLESRYQEYKAAMASGNIKIFTQDLSFSLNVRKDLMALNTLIVRYSGHIDAIRKESPVEPMPRVTYIEERLGLAVTPQEVEADNKRREEELELLGPLCYQKENKKFSEWILDIEANVRVEAQKLYTDKNTKFLTGTDKIPDYLRVYFEGIKRQMEDFRQSCCRSLRDACLKLSDLAESVNEMVFGSLKKRYMERSVDNNNDKNGSFDAIAEQVEKTKDEHTFMLRPNLANPACKEEFDSLNAKEAERLSKYVQDIEQYKKEINDDTQTTANLFLKALVNNFELLILYYDRLYLFEDFNRLPGDEEIQKKRANLKTLITTKMTGVVIDRTTERCIEKKWQGFPMDSFMLSKGTPLPYTEDELLAPAEAQAQSKDKAAPGGKKAPPKKDDKKGKEAPKKPAANNAPEVKDENAVPNTREVPSFKTFRQKTCYQQRNKAYEEYKNYFENTVKHNNEKFNQLAEREHKFQFQWERSIDQIFYKA